MILLKDNNSIQINGYFEQYNTDKAIFMQVKNFLDTIINM